MTVTGELWTCPDCHVTERADGLPVTDVPRWRHTVQAGHAARHRAERQRVRTVADALLDATEAIAAFRVRIAVNVTEVDRVRAMIVRRSLPVEVFADANLAPGEAYVTQPRRGVREATR